jgi:hypothetical protein
MYNLRTLRIKLQLNQAQLSLFLVQQISHHLIIEDFKPNSKTQINSQQKKLLLDFIPPTNLVKIP